jgi:hypothetical protein
MKLKFGWNFKHNVEEGALPDTLETLGYPSRFSYSRNLSQSNF